VIFLKNFVTVLMLTTTLMVLGACGSGNNSSESDKTLTILVEGGSPAEHVALETADEFEEQTGYSIELDTVPYSGVYDKLNAEIKAGRAVHDVAIIDVLWFPALANGLEPIDDLLSEEELNDFLPGLADSATIDNQLLGIPKWTNSKVLIYREDLFEDPTNQENFQKEYNYELTVPTTWEEYRDVAEFFTDEDMYGAAIFGQTGGDAVSSWLDLAAQAGADPLIMDENNNVNINESPYVESLEFLQSLIEDGSVPQDYLAMASTEIDELFKSGDLAMQIAWGHFYLSSKEQLPGQVAVAPNLEGEAGIGSLPGPWYQVILKDSDKKEIAREYLQFMYERNEMYMDSLGVAARESVFSQYENDEEFAHVDAISQTLNGSQTQNRPQVVEWTQIENEILSPMLQNVLSGEDAQEQLDSAKESIEDLMGE
jgi:multiple sugar transport system substrate-binding protein